MSGPPFPGPPGVGSNQIGDFQIGLSPIGTIPAFDVWTTIISQYSNSDRLDAILTSYATAMDMTEPFDDFYDFEFNVLTAQGYGLDVWGRIVDVSRTIQLPSGSGSYLGFEEAGSSWSGFGQAPFYSGGTLTNNVSLADADYRTLILAKAAANICDGSIPAINAILLALFPGSGDCYCTDLGNMQMQYVFKFALTPIQLAIVENSGALPTPVGVASSVVVT
jgi:hypothetical protein